METKSIEFYWDSIPVGRENAEPYEHFMDIWGLSDKRAVRKIFQQLGYVDFGDNYVLIRSSHTRGFFRSDDPVELRAFKKECLSKGRCLFAPVHKINRILRDEEDWQMNFFNNMKAVRIDRGKLQTEVCEYFRIKGELLDVPLLSKMENGFCLPTPAQLRRLAEYYECAEDDLVRASYIPSETGEKR